MVIVNFCDAEQDSEYRLLRGETNGMIYASLNVTKARNILRF